MLVVEAKKSSPKEDSQPNFDKYIQDIRDKMINSFSIGWALCLQRHPHYEELPEPFRLLDLSNTVPRFVLVIKDHKDKWLPPIQQALKKALNRTIKCWAIPPMSVLVFNEALAQKHGLILPRENQGQKE